MLALTSGHLGMAKGREVEGVEGEPARERGEVNNNWANSTFSFKEPDEGARAHWRLSLRHK